MAGINGSMAHLSDGLFTTSIAVYAAAMVGFTAEYAFGRVGRKLEVAEPARELVGAGGPPVPDRPVVVDDAPAAGKRRRADRIGRWAVVITVLGALVHLSSIVVRAVAVDAVPWSNMYEFASVAGLVGVLAFLALLWKLPALRHLGGMILLPVILLMFLAGTVLYSQAQPLVPALQSYWLAIHVVLVSIAEGALMTSAVLTVLYLVKSRHDKLGGRPDYKPGAIGTLAAKLPSAAVLDKAAYRVVAFSFPLYTVAIICGAIWAEAAWGRYWGWDPKETWAFIVWVIYACYLHARATAGWKGRAAAWVNLAGFCAITFNFLIVNIVVSGLHSYAGLS
ncbi:MAG: c-type cytochrome biogenesis protein CcsB [Jatrophihabitans sp.]|uniref:c-type cytochrome biogenesis protein CcsB n=1 Tax=Jatrophihabitans sp. TaxID=1932789 RepID=UPI003915F5AC